MRWRHLSLVGLLATFATLAILTPALILSLAAVRDPLPWQRLSEAGEAFGAVSAGVSAVALLGVVTSLMIQQQQNRMMEEQTVRQRHFDLVRLTMENPKFLYAWGVRPDADDDPELLGFGNLIVSHWLMLWRIRNIDEETLRRNAAGYFAGSVGRDHWQRGGPGWATPDRRTERFVEIMNDEFRRAVSQGPPISVPPSRAGRPATSRKNWRLVTEIAIAGMAILAVRQAGRRQDPARRT
jgi:hypothetical protein